MLEIELSGIPSSSDDEAQPFPTTSTPSSYSPSRTPSRTSYSSPHSTPHSPSPYSPTVVYIPGVWDLLHVGHLHILGQARDLGDRLVVGVPSDAVVEEDKGSPPVITLQDRVRMLQALRCVTLVIPYHKLEFLTHLEWVRPQVLVVGEQWGTLQRHKDAEEWMANHGGRVVMVSRYPNESTTDIKRRVVEQHLRRVRT